MRPLLALSAFALLGLAAAATPAAACDPRNNVCLGQPCHTSAGDMVGVTAMDGDNKNLVVCALNDANEFRWKSMSPVTLLPNGNVGIGTTTPGYSVGMRGGLTINGTEATQFTVMKDGRNAFALNADASGAWALYNFANSDWALAITAAGGKVGIGTTAGPTALNVNGEARVGSTGAACTSANAGAIRYSSTTNTFEGCNGSEWKSLGGEKKGSWCGLYQIQQLGNVSQYNTLVGCENFVPSNSGYNPNCPSGYYGHTLYDSVSGNTVGDGVITYACIKQ